MVEPDHPLIAPRLLATYGLLAIPGIGIALMSIRILGIGAVICALGAAGIISLYWSDFRQLRLRVINGTISEVPTRELWVAIVIVLVAIIAPASIGIYAAVAPSQISNLAPPNVRQLTGEERVRLVTSLRGAGGTDQSVEINSASNCDECEEYAHELRDAINSVSGWKATGGTTIFGSAAIRGIRFDVRSLDKRPQAIIKLGAAFEAAKIPFEWIETEQLAQGYEYHVFVARRLRR
jgi:hypothetical protein